MPAQGESQKTNVHAKASSTRAQSLLVPPYHFAVEFRSAHSSRPKDLLHLREDIQICRFLLGNSGGDHFGLGVVLASVGSFQSGRGSRSARCDKTCPHVLSSNSVCTNR